ncbi:MAG: hypothetical protein IJQ31_08235 [Thermoguttaceae bacterium]|nr:hypothetical protein [Thermoguttaceae bacterium]
MKIFKLALLILGLALVLPPVCAQAAEGKELQKEVQTALKHWKKVEAPQAETAARELLGLYREVEADEALPDSTRNLLLRNLRVKLDVLSIQIAEAELAQKKAQKQDEEAKEKKPATVKRPEKAQQAEMAQMGVPGVGAGAGAGRGQISEEAGEQLVEVIQNTIHPESWEQNGGNGTIQFWSPNGHLIIRQTDENHQKIQNLLEQLRRAGS